MATLSVKSLAFTATEPLFSGLTFSLSPGDRLGVVAGNGRGKSTLLRLMAGQLDPTAGEIITSRGARLGIMDQMVPERLLTLSLDDAVLDALPPEARDTDRWRVDVILDGLGTDTALRSRPLNALSGGWQRLALVARLLVTEPDVLLLDEPTNHLDLGQIMRLEAWLKREARDLPMVIVSHDRDFLDALTTRTLFLRPGESRLFAVPYSAARAALDDADAADARDFARDVKAAGKLRDQARKLTNIGINSGSDLLTVKARQLKDRATRIEAAARPAHRERQGEIRLATSETHARAILQLDAFAVTTPDGGPLYRIDRLVLAPGDRLMLLGRNGTGKSRLIRAINEAAEGRPAAGLKLARVTLGYADQDMEALISAGTPTDYVSQSFDEPDARTRSLLAAIGIPLEKQGRPIAELSPGQRGRLGLLGLRLTAPSFYLLDEPTNHIDIAGREALEAEILDKAATAVIVSHDRAFVRRVGTRFAEIVGRRLVEVDSPEPFFTRLRADIAP
jgi:ATPase subunit of ABC transporter with duplicated ATPase domains